MPVKWSAAMDQLLLTKILETHNLSVDTRKVSEAWPGEDPNSKPTHRAITERLVKIKSLSKTANGATSTPTTPSTKSTPRKRAAANGSGSSTKRPRVNVKAENDTPTRQGGPIKNEPSDESDDSLAALDTFAPMRTPSKRARIAPSLPAGMTTYNDNTDGEIGGYESSASEFMVPVKKEAESGGVQEVAVQGEFGEFALPVGQSDYA
ncbi:hypothetical protein FQN50_006355 [Emmonsiellopsis sp. PD_5]|nr:hypothetical protein FQN50_006355 [Emmonsiellopsis sp. PD_5]